MPTEPNAKARVFSADSRSADTNILAANVTPSSGPALFEITTAVNTSAQPKITEWNGSAGETYHLNNGSALGANQLLRESIAVREGSEYNVQFGSDVNVLVLNVDERGYYKD